MERTNRFSIAELNAVCFAVVVFLTLTILLAFPFSVGITGTETRQISVTQLQQTTFLQEPFFSAQLAIGREIIEIPEKAPTTATASGYTIKKVDAETGTPITQITLDPRPMTWGEALSLGLSPKDFLTRFITPGLIPAALIGIVGSGIALVGYTAALQKKEYFSK